MNSAAIGLGKASLANGSVLLTSFRIMTIACAKKTVIAVGTYFHATIRPFDPSSFPSSLLRVEHQHKTVVTIISTAEQAADIPKKSGWRVYGNQFAGSLGLSELR